MPYATSNGVRIYYETMGEPTGEPAIFIMGFSWPLIGWREEFCQKFAERGIFLIRPDNRDVGLSQKFGGPEDVDGHYTLADMAHDMFGVLDALKLESAHIVGQSMGGIIAQLMAIAHPQRVRSLSLIFTAPALDYVTQEGKSEVAASDGSRYASREEAIEAFVQTERGSTGTLYAFDEQWIRASAARSYDRCYCPEGAARQAAAVMRLGDLRPQLTRLEMPTALIHGRGDRLVTFESTLEMGRLLRNAEVHVYPGMGHELPRPLWDEFVNIITRTVLRGRAA